MTDEKFATIWVGGLIFVVLLFVGGLISYSTESYWEYHNTLLKQGKVILHVPGHDQVQPTK